MITPNPDCVGCFGRSDLQPCASCGRDLKPDNPALIAPRLTAAEIFQRLSEWSAREALARRPVIVTAPGSQQLDAARESKMLAAWAQELRFLAKWAHGHPADGAAVAVALHWLGTQPGQDELDPMRKAILWAYRQSAPEALRLLALRSPVADVTPALRLWSHLLRQASVEVEQRMNAALPEVRATVPALAHSRERIVQDLCDLVEAL